MNTKSKARKQLAVDTEVERLRLKEASLTDADRARMAKRQRRTTIFLAMFVVALVVGVVSAVIAGPMKSLVDAGAQLSCQHFRNVVGDISQGLLTDAEGHAKFEQVYSLARGSSILTIRQGAQTVLAADVSGDPAALSTAMTNFSNVCASLGQ